MRYPRRPADSDEFQSLRAEAMVVAQEWLRLMKQRPVDPDEVTALRTRMDFHQRALDRWREKRDRELQS